MSHLRRPSRLSGFLAAVAVLVVVPSLAGPEPSASARRHAPIDVRRNPDGSPARGLRNQLVSGNWSGYELANYQTAQNYTQAQLTWMVPSVAYGASTDSTSSSEYSSNWVGIGGFCMNSRCTRGDHTLIQLGTEQDVAPNGATQYYAWYEMLPAAETPLPPGHPVSAGDVITASLACNNPCTAKKQSWTLAMTNHTQNWSWSGTFAYASSLASAEWIEEAPYQGGILPLADFATASFSATGGVNNGQTPALSLATNGIQMQNPWGQTSNPSAANGLADFDACWGFQNMTACAAP